jgi:hypothetical protein
MLDANDGDVDATTEQLVKINDRLEQESKNREELEKQRNVENLVIRFGFSPEVTRQVLAHAKWDLGEAVKELVHRQTEVKISEFVRLYSVRS